MRITCHREHRAINDLRDRCGTIIGRNPIDRHLRADGQPNRGAKIMQRAVQLLAARQACGGSDPVAQARKSREEPDGRYTRPLRFCACQRIS